MVNKKDRTFIIFSAAILLLLVIVVVCAIVAIVAISPDIEQLLSGIPIAQENPGAGLSGRQLAYICCPGDNAVRAVDPSTLLVATTMSFNETPYLAVPNPNGLDVYVAAGKDVFIVSTKDPSTRRKLTYPDPVNHIVFNPDGRIVYLECGNSARSYLLAVSTGDLQLLDSMENIPAAQGVAISPDGKYLYVPDQLRQELAIISLYNYTKMNPLPCFGLPYDVAVSSDGSLVYVGMMANDVLMVFNAETLTYNKTIRLPVKNTYCLAVRPDGKFLYAANSDEWLSTVTVMDAEDHVQKEISIGKLPKDMQVSPDGRSLFVCTGYDPVEVIDTDTFKVRSLGFIGSSVEFSRKIS